MCGISGIIADFENSKLIEVVHKMTDRLAHRGPNAEGFYVDENIAFGHRRLSIIDLSDESNQPFIDNTGRYIIVFNGEIYNYKEIKLLLTDYNFRTEGDTEVILAAYIKWGELCLDHLNGMFAFSIWDKNENKLFIARDRLGVKPFYYFHNADFFAFSSEIRSLLSSCLIERKVNFEAIKDFLTYSSVSAPNTIIKNIFQLMPGECGILIDGKLEKKYYWQIEKNYVGTVPDNYEIIKKDIKNLLTASVERRLISDVPLGAFLSGGIDSSSIVALMAEVSSNPVNTFSIVFNERMYDESKYSQIIAKKFNTKHTSILLKPEDFLKILPEALKAMDTPTGDGINTYLVSKLTKNAGITVALSGLGGDELFAGYPLFDQWKSVNNFNFFWKLPKSLRLLVGNAIEAGLNDNKVGRIKEMLSVEDFNFSSVYPVLRKLIISEDINKIFKPDNFEFNIIENILSERLNDIKKLPFYSQVSVGELLSYTLNTLLKDTDQMSMASALEIREPFFDYKLVEYVMQVPDKYKFRKYKKSLLVESLSTLLPSEIVHRPKMGFVFPWDVWMKNELKDFCEDKIYRLAKSSIFESSQIIKIWEDFLAGNKRVLWSYVWQLVVLENWLLENDIQD